MAREFGINRGSVYEWIRKGWVPVKRCPRIVEMAGGAVSCEDLCGSFDWEGARRVAMRTLDAGA
ncbi:hypothetical protein D3C87_2115930 [compost metagenome]